MMKLPNESAAKLQKILSKRIGRELSQEELEEAYDALIGFAYALVDLDNTGPQDKKQSPQHNLKLPIANSPIYFV